MRLIGVLEGFSLSVSLLDIILHDLFSLLLKPSLLSLLFNHFSTVVLLNVDFLKWSWS